MAQGFKKIRRVLVSVSDKSRLVEFIMALWKMGIEVVSTGGTCTALVAVGIPAISVETVTGFPPLFDGRVKTLDPKILGGILARRGVASDLAEMEQYGIRGFDMVINSLYPFQKKVADPACTYADAVENIDIGGVTMLRAAAKNHEDVAVVIEVSQYDAILAEMQANEGCLSQETRSRLAREAFSLTASYDSAIAGYLNRKQGVKFPKRLTLSYQLAQGFRYGENPHMEGALYRSGDTSEPCVANAELLPGGKALSLCNFFDGNGGLELVKEFDRPSVAIIKHANPAGCASDEDLVEAYRKAYMADVNAAMGGIIEVNRPVTRALAAAIVNTYKNWGKAAGAGGFFAELIIAPSFDDGAELIIRAKEGWGSEVRLLTVGPLTGQRNREMGLKCIVGGILYQDRDLLGLNQTVWEVMSKRPPTASELRDLCFAWLVVKHGKSNAIVLARNEILLGAGFGQMSRVNSAMLATMLARRWGASAMDPDYDTKGCVLASDAFFPFKDSLDWAVNAGATAVIEPGGSKKDDEVIARADELELALVFTGTRHFNH